MEENWSPGEVIWICPAETCSSVTTQAAWGVPWWETAKWEKGKRGSDRIHCSYLTATQLWFQVLNFPLAHFNLVFVCYLVFFLSFFSSQPWWWFWFLALLQHCLSCLESVSPSPPWGGRGTCSDVPSWHVFRQGDTSQMWITTVSCSIPRDSLTAVLSCWGACSMCWQISVEAVGTAFRDLPCPCARGGLGF